eukprot:TRINITY_DN32_c0_g1_i3.p2 TRINITY_DN32_c0_g1~~TRINITY_DN32_c0_g1_i3.p2  ORF type:complete len:115 (-),score=3.64 TRINITY_DN32_c0_g1_i3:25-369(-)
MTPETGHGCRVRQSLGARLFLSLKHRGKASKATGGQRPLDNGGCNEEATAALPPFLLLNPAELVLALLAEKRTRRRARNVLEGAAPVRLGQLVPGGPAGQLARPIAFHVLHRRG